MRINLGFGFSGLVYLGFRVYCAHRFRIAVVWIDESRIRGSGGGGGRGRGLTATITRIVSLNNLAPSILITLVTASKDPRSQGWGFAGYRANIDQQQIITTSSALNL